MTMHRKNRLVNVRHMLLEILDNIKVLRRNGIANRIGNIHHFGTGGNNLFHHLSKKGKTGPHRVLGRKFHIRRITRSAPHGGHGSIEHLLFTHLELVFHVNVTGGDKSMNPGPFPGWFKSLPGTVDIQIAGSAKSGNLTVVSRLGNPFDSFKIPFGSDRKSCFDDIDIQFFELNRDTQLLVDIHTGTGRLLAIAQGSIKNLNSLDVIHVTSRKSVVHPIQRCEESCVE